MIKFKKCPFSRKKKKLLKRKINSFLIKENISHMLKEIKLDWTKIKTVNTEGGYYGGLISLYKNNKAYINLTVFYELTSLKDLNQILWAIFHELIHCKQMYTKEIVISDDNNSLIYKNKKYEKLDFRGEEFCKIYENDHFKATEYHINSIPWELECYYKSDIYTNKKSFNHSNYMEKLC